jgi:hypothetical protein
MIRRCYSPKCPEYKSYGARGIKVCKPWLKPMPEGFERFLKDMGKCPKGMTLERINVNGNYTKNNCRWDTKKSQSNNKRTSVHIKLGRTTKNLSDWAKKFGCSTYRVKRGRDLFGEDYRKVKEYCKSVLYNTNTTGYPRISERPNGKGYTVSYKDETKWKTKKVKTLNEALKFDASRRKE